VNLSLLLRFFCVVLTLVLSSLRANSNSVSAASSVAQTRLVLRRFVAVYNQHDLTVVRSMVTANVRWIDCDFARHRVVRVHGKRAATAWFRARFAQHDKLQVSRILAGGWSNDRFDPRVFGLMGTRTNDVTQSQGLPAQPLVGSKGVLDSTGTRIDFYLVADAAGCAT
jgi:hypothetical protein